MYGVKSKPDVQEKCNTSVKDKIRHAVCTDSGNIVISRVFYNSMVRKQNVQALLARGNKTKHLAAGSTLWKGVKMGTPQTHVTTVSTQGNCDSPLSDIGVDGNRGQGVKSIAQQSQNNSILTGVNTTIASGQQKVAPLSGNNRTSNRVESLSKEGGALFSSPDTGNSEVTSVDEGLTSGQQSFTPQRVHNTSTNVANTNLSSNKDYCPTTCQESDKHYSAISKVIEKREVDQDSNILSPNQMNDKNNSMGQGCDLALLYDVNGLNDKFTNIVGSVFHNKIDMKRGNEYGPNFSLWREQSRFDFGFIPLSDFTMPENTKQAKSIQCPIQIHNLVKRSGVYNFLGCRIPIKSQLNLDEWSHQLRGYWDVQLIDLLTYGFPLDFNRKSPLNWEDKNHKSAVEYPKDVEAYLLEEVHHGAIMGPYSVHPIAHSHFSPFMTREKSNAAHRRVIIDLSWPKAASVNLGVDKNSYLATDFILNLPTVDHITKELRNIGRGAHLFKVDVSRAFRHVKLDPSDYDLLGLKWNDLTYFDTCLPFGSRHGTQIFQHLSDAIRHMMRHLGFDVLNYVDDFVGIGTPSVARRSYDALIQLLQKLGLEVSAKKLVPPSTKAVCLGIEIDSENCTVAIPPDKLRHICDMVNEWRQLHFCSKRQLQSRLSKRPALVSKIFDHIQWHIIFRPQEGR